MYQSCAGGTRVAFRPPVVHLLRDLKTSVQNRLQRKNDRKHGEPYLLTAQYVV